MMVIIDMNEGRNLKTILALLATSVLILAWVAVIPNAQAQTLVVGVWPGALFVYGVKCFWSSTDPSAICPQNYLDVNKTEWIQVNITTVNGPDVDYKQTFHFENGTEVQHSVTADMETGNATSYSVPFFVLFPGNLTANELTYGLTINETIMRQYPSGQRETNHITTNDTNTERGGGYYYSDVYLDRFTGMSVETYFKSVEIPINAEAVVYETTVFHSILISSNVWLIPEIPSFLFLPLLMMITLLAVMISQKRKKEKLRTATCVF
jgi:hypothetical protein